MKTCFIITTYCDTQEKLNSLTDTVNRIAPYGYDIILYNHYPIHGDVLNNINFSIYDKSNPVIWNMQHRAMTLWTKVINTPYKLTRNMPDYGYAVAQQWKRSLEFVYNMGYERAYIINYDAKFSDSFFKRANDYLNTNQCFAIEYGQNSIYLAFFGVNLSENFVKKFNVVSESHYISTVGNYVAEGYIYSLISEYISRVHTFSEFENTDITSDITIAVIDKFYIGDGYRVTAGLEKFVFGDQTPNYNRLAILVYDIDKDIHISVEYDNSIIMELTIHRDMNYMYSHVPLNYSSIDYSKLKFLINGVENEKLLFYSQHVVIETLYQTF